MKKVKLAKIIIGMLVINLISILNPIGANADWIQTYTDPQSFSYEENGTLVTGWKYIDNGWYYLDPNSGYAVTGWHYIDGNWYYFGIIRGVLAQNIITPYNYKAEKGFYYLNSSGVYVENPPKEIQAYINLLKNRDSLIDLRIIDSGTHKFKPVIDTNKIILPELDHIIQDEISDNDGDGILEMQTKSNFGINRTVKYSDGNIYVYGDDNELIQSISNSDYVTDKLISSINDSDNSNSNNSNLDNLNLIRFQEIY